MNQGSGDPCGSLVLGVAVGVVDFGHIGSDLQGSHFDLDVSSATLENDWLLQEGSW